MTNNMPRYTTKRLHDEIAKAKSYGLELAAQLIDQNIIMDTNTGKVLAPRQDGNREGQHYAVAIRGLSHQGDTESVDAQAPSPEHHVAGSFQSRVQPWMLACFGEMIAGDREERNHRFLEEALELVQSAGCTASEAHQLVDYVYGRPIGEPNQEVGGVMVTLAALCLANALDMHQAGEPELSRIWTKVDAIRAKQAAKPKHSPLPGPSATTEGQKDG